MFKKLFFVLIPMFFIFALGLVGCAVSVRGSGDVVTEGREVSGFDRVSLDGVGELILTQGSSESLRIEAEDNLMPYIKTVVRGDELVISINSRRPIVPSREIKFYVTARDIEAISLDGAGVIESEKISAESLELSIDGTGQINIDQLDAEDVTVEISGLGDLNVSGSVINQDIEIDGAGNYDGRSLMSETAVVSIDGLGSADIAVAGSLDVSINGSGRVEYTGDPQISTDIDGLGQVTQR